MGRVYDEVERGLARERLTPTRKVAVGILIVIGVVASVFSLVTAVQGTGDDRLDQLDGSELAAHVVARDYRVFFVGSEADGDRIMAVGVGSRKAVCDLDDAVVVSCSWIKGPVR